MSTHCFWQVTERFTLVVDRIGDSTEEIPSEELDKAFDELKSDPKNLISFYKRAKKLIYQTETNSNILARRTPGLAQFTFTNSQGPLDADLPFFRSFAEDVIDRGREVLRTAGLCLVRHRRPCSTVPEHQRHRCEEPKAYQ